MAEGGEPMVLARRGTLTTLYCGTRGWEHPQWRGAFYPDDLPETWRTDYYAAHYFAVSLPEACWRGVGREQLGEWLDSLGERGLVVVELALESEALDALLALDTEITDRLDALLLQPGAQDTELLARLRRQLPHMPCYLNGPLSVELAERFQLLPLWRVGRQGCTSTNLGLLSSADSLATTAADFNAFVTQAAEWSTALLLVEGGELLARLAELQALTELHGL